MQIVTIIGGGPPLHWWVPAEESTSARMFEIFVLSNSGFRDWKPWW